MSLRRRMILGGSLWLLLALISIFVVLTLAISQSLERTFERQLSFDVDSLIASLEVDEQTNTLSLTRDPANPLFSKPYSGWYWHIHHDGGDLRSRSLWDKDLNVNAHVSTDGKLHIHRTSGPNNESLQVVERDISFPDLTGVVHVRVGADRSALLTERALLLGYLGASLGALGVWLLIANLFQVSYVMKPLKDLKNKLDEMRRSPENRLPEDQPAEIAPMVTAFNAVLDHDADMIARARAHVGNLAHGLKTPISVLQSASHNSETVPSEVVRTELDLMRRLVERHLAKARAVTGSSSARGTTVSVGEITSRLKKALLALHHKDIKIDVDIKEDALFRGDPDDLMEMLGNLLDNACKWANSRIRVFAGKQADRSLVILIEDDGPGLSENHKTLAMTRGARLDDTTPGHGLGLDIVRDLISLYGGTIRLDRSTLLGGLMVEIRFKDR